MSGLQGDEAARYHAAFTTLSREMTGQVFRREGCADSNQPGIALTISALSPCRTTGGAASGPHQYGGCFFSRCAVAASIHHARSSANRGNACASALPPSPVGLPSADKVWPIGPAAIVDDTTTIPISDSVPCQAVAARAPAKRPAE